MHHDESLRLEFKWQSSHPFRSPSKEPWHWQGDWTLHVQVIVRKVSIKHRKWSRLCCERQHFSPRDRDPGCGWNTALWLPRHDLGQAAWAVRSRVSSSPKQRYDIQVGWEPCREVLSLAQRIIIPGPAPKHTARWRAIPSKDPGSGTQPKHRPYVLSELQVHCYTFTSVNNRRCKRS